MSEQGGTEPGIEVVHDPGRRRYTISIDEAPAGFAAYRVPSSGPSDGEGETLDFHHTEIDPAFGGRGLGSALVAEAVADVRARGGRIVPTCPFVAAWFRKHPEAADALAT